MRRFKVIAIAALLAGAGLMGHGCGKPTGDSDDRLDIFIANKDLPADGTSKTSVTATVRDPAGEPEKREGITAVFETTAGTLDPAVVPVAAGVATTMLTSSLDPKLAVMVTVHTEPEGLQASDTMRFTQVTAGGISLDCSPSLLEANGVAEALCTATVTLPNGSPVPNGTPVNFTTTLGTISPASATTTNGIATATLRSATTGGTAVVTASSGSSSATFRVQFSDNPPTRVTLQAIPREIQADGRDQSIITVSVRRRDGSAALDGTPVDCATDAGTLTESRPTTTDGIATTRLTAGTTVATAHVVCVAGTGRDQISINIVESTGGEVTDIRVSANPASIRVQGQTSTITARVRNDTGGAIVGEDVFFSVDGPVGVTITPTEAQTDSSGNATATLRSGAGAGDATVTAEARNTSGSTDVTILPNPPQTITVNPQGSSINAGDTMTVSALVQDGFGNPVQDGTSVSWFVSCPGVANCPTGADRTCDAFVFLSQPSSPTSNGVAGNTLNVQGSTAETSVNIIARAQGGAAPEACSATVAITRAPTPTPTQTPGPTNTPTATTTPTVTGTPPTSTPTQPR